MTDLLIKGNKKMGDKVFIFNLPPIITCTPTNWCLHGKNGKPMCYALRRRFLFPNVIDGAKIRYKLSQQPNFVDKMIAKIHRKKPEFFRFHSSGDFYSADYVKKVIEIAKQCPDTLFRTTTRRRDLTKVLQELNELPNFIVRESLDTQRQIPKMGLPFTALSYLDIVKQTKTYECLEDCEKCRHYCWKHQVNIHFYEF